MRQGFTLIEIMVTTTIFVVVMGTAMSFLLNSSNTTAYNEGKLLINRDIRAFTSELSDRATFANFFEIYTSFTDRSEQNAGRSGDFLVLVYTEPTDPSLYKRIIGYYRAASGSTEGPVQKFEIDYTTPASGNILDLLPATSTLGTHEEVIELSKGLSDGRLFYNFYDRSITVQGEILHEGSTLKRATNTYNFTISPRG